MHIEHTDESSTQRRPNVCLIDDDDIMLSLFTRIIQRSGCDVEAAKGPKEAMAALSSTTFDLVICDLRMPDMSDGEELLGIIHKSFPQLSIVMMSCDVPSEVHERLIAAGASDCVTKPITVATVSTLINTLNNPELCRLPDAS
ncbi:response regulator [Granulosicoccus antarcticus]|uniref:Nitrogen regulation protein NR(I) n=1 Tax=Granulosicoccus antarcticus IMCC3135 TaxID=1192854 RepID=A0A2Z2NMA7_9GAMM|nr:response regulator [Granulosicoccus antarcticus]ASJ72323.1 Nitrogen regulation protein NR(I) [Granulosicoccus antarcticus IMCC3135]